MCNDPTMAWRLRTLSLNLPLGIGGVTVEVTEAGAHAAWELYVELVTRITEHPLGAGAGSAREALDSLYSLFATTREILRRIGPEVADGPNSFGPLAIRVLNEGIRPFVLRWHKELPPASTELDAGVRAAFDRELAEMQHALAEYVEVLAHIAGVREE